MSRSEKESVAAVMGDVVATRRRAIGAVAKATAATGLVLTGANARVDNVSAARATAADLEVVRQLIVVEQTALGLFRDGLSQFTSDETTSGDRNLPTQPTLTRIAYHEGSHLSLLTAAAAELGTDVTLGAHPDFTFTDFAMFLRRAAELKQRHVAAYVAAVTALENVKLRSLVARILAVEARHAAYLNDRIGEEPFWVEREDLYAVSHPLQVAAQSVG